MASSAPRGNESWISKPSDTSFLPIGQKVQTTTNPIPGNINSCALTQPRASSPAPRANATSQVLTGSSLLTSTELVSSPPLYLSEPLFGSIPSTVLGGLVRSSNPPMPSDDILYDSSTTQVLSYSTSLIPPMTRRSTPPAVLGASKPTVALTPSKASYTANLSLPCPFSLCVPSPSQVYHVYTEDPQVRPLVLSCLTSPCHPSPRLRTQDPCTPPPFFIASSGPLCLRLRFYLYTKTPIATPRPLYLHRSPLCLPVYIYSREAFGTFDFRVFIA